MPKNPVRAARQASRQAVRSARTSSRQDARAIKTTKKVDAITARAASKVGKINAAAPKRAASEPMQKMESKGMTPITPKFKTAAELKSGIKMPNVSSSIKATTPRSMTEVAKSQAPAKKTAPAKKSAGKPGVKFKDSGRPAAPGPYEAAKQIQRAADKLGMSVGKMTSGSKQGKGIYDGMSKQTMDYSPNDVIRGARNTVNQTGKYIGGYINAKGKQAGDAASSAANAVGRGLDFFNPFSTKKKGGQVGKKKMARGGMVKGKKC
jgi:hypothetical protein